MNQDETPSPYNHWNLKSGLILAFNSMVMYSIASIITIFLYDLSMALMAKFFGFSPVLHYGLVELPTDNSAWMRIEVTFVFSVGSLVSMVLAILAFHRLAKTKRSKFHQRLFFFWLGLHALAVFLQKWITAGLLFDALGAVAAWYFIDKNLVILVSLLGIGFLLTASFFLPRALLHFSISRELTKAKWYKRIPFLISITIVPWLVGSFLVFSIDNSFGYRSMEFVTQSHFYIYVCMFWLLAASIIFTYKVKRVRVVKLTNAIHIAWLPLLVLCAMIVLARLSLFHGLTI